MHDKSYKELFHLFNRVHKLRFFDKIVNLSKSEFFLLDTIMRTKSQNDEKPKVTITNLAKKNCYTKPAASKMLSMMEDKGYIARLNDKQDKRLTYVTLTNEGERELKKAYKEFNEFSDMVFEKMGKEDTDEFIKLFKKLFFIIEEEIEERGK